MATVDDAIKAIGEQVGAGDFALRNRLYIRELGQEPSVSVYQSGITVNSFAETTYSIEVRYHVPPSQEAPTDKDYRLVQKAVSDLLLWLPGVDPGGMLVYWRRPPTARFDFQVDTMASVELTVCERYPRYD